MKAYFVEYDTTQDRLNKTGNTTVLVKIGTWDYQYERGSWADAVTCEYGCGNNRKHFTVTSVEKAHIRKHCTRVSEAQARLIHPEIFNSGLL